MASKSQSQKSIVRWLSSRELFSQSSLLRKANWTVLRELITGDSDVQLIGKYIAGGSCCKIIYCEGHLIINGTKGKSGKLHLEIHNLNGLNGKPKKNSKNFTLPHDWKDRDFGIGPISSCKSLFTNGFKTFLYAITPLELLRIDIHLGSIEEELQLPNNCRYTELSLDDETHLIAVSSVKNPKGNVLMNFALYNYFPNLKFQGMLVIRKSVYGATVTGAEINQGLLLTLHRGNNVKVYSFMSAYEDQNTCSPTLLEIVSFNHIVSIGANPYYMIRAVHYNSFRIHALNGANGDLTGELDEGKALEGQENSFDSYLGFHPDSSPRLIFTDNGLLRLYNIITDGDGSHSLIPAASHSLESVNPTQQTQLEITTTSGRTIKRPPNSEIYARTSLEDSSTFLAFDYEDDLDIVGVVYAHIDEDGTYMHLVLDLLDSQFGNRLKRIRLLSKLRISSHDPPEVFLRLDADLCLVSVARNGRAFIHVFRIIPTAQRHH